MGLRAGFCFAFLGLLAVALLARLAWLQGFRETSNRQAVALQRNRHEALPAPRGTIVDRDLRLLAYDRPVLEVRAEAYFDWREGHETEDYHEFAQRLAADLAFALDADGAPSAARSQRLLDLRARLLKLRDDPSGERWLRASARDGVPARWRRRLDFLVGGAIESAAVLERLDTVAAQRSWLHLHRLRRFARTYPRRAATVGPVGFVGQVLVAKDRSVPLYRGMEALAGLLPGEAGRQLVWQDATANRYWTGIAETPTAPALLQSTLDLELQECADRELTKAVEAVTERYRSPPEWGALCLAEVATGEILALASWRDGAAPEQAAFSPIQCLCPPGSVVKPLVFSLALEKGVLDWERDEFECSPSGQGLWRVPGVARVIRDSHPCGRLGPRDILVQSSNIGAGQVGLRLGREGLAEYLDVFRWGATTGTMLPGELAGVRPTDLATMPERLFRGYSAPSLSMGYDYNITPLQVLRAYVTLLSRRPRELTLYRRAVAAGGEPQSLARRPDGEIFLSAANLERLLAAMRGVVSPEVGATGRALHAELERLGRAGAVAGKTGTSEYRERRGPQGSAQLVMVRTASFAGFAPADRPRFAAVCVLQKPGAASFWGGRYAGPAAGRLLLRAVTRSELGERRRSVRRSLAKVGQVRQQ